ncbi:MAG: hypothetical protein JXR86_02230 [Spirochaetales bacterium]|nr:hypothetical protein [Spirochaetales bacterium]
MKKIFWSAALMILVLAGCVTTEPQVVETPVQEEKAATPVEPVQETRIIDVYLPVKETIKSSDGIVDGYREFDYDDAGNLLEEREYNSEGILLTKMENTVEGGQIVRTQYFRGEENEPGIYILRKYEKGYAVEEISYDQKDVPQTISRYERDSNGNVLKWTVASGDNVPMMVTRYEYSGDIRIKAEFLTPLGESEGFIEYEWDEENLSSEKTYDADGKLDKAVEYAYEGGFLVGETHYRKTVVNYTIAYEVDDVGNALVKKQYYRSGNLKAEWEYEYTSIKKEVLK